MNSLGIREYWLDEEYCRGEVLEGLEICERCNDLEEATDCVLCDKSYCHYCMRGSYPVCHDCCEKHDELELCECPDCREVREAKAFLKE